jgi:hypothetical protein
VTLPAVSPLAAEPLAASTPSGGGASGSDVFFDVLLTVLSQYANSPVVLKLIGYFSEWLDPASRFDAFYRNIWDITQAKGYGLDVWGRILGVTRVLEVPAGVYLGFEQDEEARPFGFGVLYRGGRSTNSAALTDEAYRLLLLAKAALNITNASAPAINQILLALFGMGYVRDNLDMTMTYVFSRALEPVEKAIVFQSGAIPKPAGVSFTVEEA